MKNRFPTKEILYILQKMVVLWTGELWLNNQNSLSGLTNLRGLSVPIFLVVPVICSCLEHTFFDATFGDKALLHGDEQFV